MKQVKGTVNQIELVGWLGAAPELRFLATGTPLCRLRVATKRLAGQDASGKQAYETDWTAVEVWERLAEQCSRYLEKGSRVRVVGSLRTDSWTDKETGQQRSKTYVRAEDVLFLDARPEPTAEAEATDQAAEEVPF